MSESEQSIIAEDVANLDLKELEVTENSNTGETTESITSINLITTESANSNNLEAMESVTNGAKADAEKEEKAAVTIAGAGSGDGEQQSFNRDLEFDGNTSKLPSLFSGPRTYLTREANAEYLARLIKEKENLSALPNTFEFKHAVRLVNEEIDKIRESIDRMAEVTEDGAESTQASGTRQEATKDTPSTTTSGKKVFLQEKIFVPVNEYPNYNFVGRILGPRGMTAKQLEEESGCRIMIRGRGSTREGSSNRQNIHNDHMKEELHVLVQCEDFEEVAKEKMKRAVECIRYMLIPPPEGEDELKRKQLMELSIINGTYRPTIASRMALRNRSLPPPFNFGQIGMENTIHGVNNLPIFANGGIEGDRRATFHDTRAGVNLPYGLAQQYPYNAYTINTRQALSSLGFDMDAFEITDCYGKRMSRSSLGFPGNQVAAATATATTAQYPRPYGFGAPLMDSFAMQYMWNPTINSAMFGVFDNSSNALAREYYNQVMAGFAPTISGNGASIGDGMAQSSNAQSVNLQQYITAAALLSGSPNFRTDGSGDGPSGHH